MFIFEVEFEEIRKAYQVDGRQMFHLRLPDRYEIYQPLGSVLLRATIWLEEGSEREDERILINYLSNSIPVTNLREHHEERDLRFGPEEIEVEVSDVEEEEISEEIREENEE